MTKCLTHIREGAVQKEGTGYLATLACACGVGHPDYVGLQVPDEELVERVTGRRLDPETGEIYHMRFKPPPEGVHGRLVQRSDDTEDKLRTRLATHHANVAAVVGYYKDVLVQVRSVPYPTPNAEKLSQI